MRGTGNYIPGYLVQSCAIPLEMRFQASIRFKKLKDLMGSVQRRQDQYGKTPSANCRTYCFTGRRACTRVFRM